MKFPDTFDKAAIDKVKEHLPPPSKCPYCTSTNIGVKHHKEVYGRQYSNWPWLYACNVCGARTGMHEGTNLPLGTLADEETRDARNYCKEFFEILWKSGAMPRQRAYAMLAKRLGIKREECHWGYFSAGMCYKAKEICDEIYKELTEVADGKKK